ncbi:hypothetical protein TSAR_007169 [Trichomalopsis sarcophagae]|uniref:Uncharacterized protein n=1 Tax=Trichomalopsis sarcophagae TaxID=543379 RepID=A0A232ER70_9HYME|nr:hypothetical protein TSAR_007169 [Trichomalopsis sarcophagae]
MGDFESKRQCEDQVFHDFGIRFPTKRFYLLLAQKIHPFTWNLTDSEKVHKFLHRVPQWASRNNEGFSMIKLKGLKVVCPLKFFSELNVKPFAYPVRISSVVPSRPEEKSTAVKMAPSELHEVDVEPMAPSSVLELSKRLRDLLLSLTAPTTSCRARSDERRVQFSIRRQAVDSSRCLSLATNRPNLDICDYCSSERPPKCCGAEMPKKSFLTSLMEDAWGVKCPKNGFSLVKSYLNKQYQAIQRNSELTLPDICQGFKIVNIGCSISTAEIGCFATQPVETQLTIVAGHSRVALSPTVAAAPTPPPVVQALRVPVSAIAEATTGD